ILKKLSAPDAIGTTLGLTWSCLPFVCLASFALLARRESISSWMTLLACLALAIYDCISYWDAYWLCCRREGSKEFPGLNFGGHVLGFGLFIQWPWVVLTATTVVIRLAFTRRQCADGCL